MTPETKSVLLSLRAIQRVPGEKPETLELMTDGLMKRRGNCTEISYLETEMTGMEGVRTSFAIFGKEKIILTRDGEKLKNRMEFEMGKKNDSLYDVGFGALLITVSARRIEVALDECGGTFEVEYGVEVEHSAMGTNTYHVEVREKS